MTIYATFNPIGSFSPKDLIDNAQNLDWLILGPLLSYPDRIGVNRLSWAGIEASFAAAQTARANEYTADKSYRDNTFSEDQSYRVTQFNAFLASSGYETPVAYAAGLSITRSTQIVLQAGELYRPKVASLPFTTTTFAADEAKWIANGDNSLRQNLAAPPGSAMLGHDGPEATVKEALDTRASGNSGKMYNLFGGTFRKDLSLAPTWKGIFDSAHVSSLMTEPEESSVDLKLNYATGDNKDICTMLTQPDETFAKAGVSFGSSVNKDYCLVSGGAPVDFTVDLTNTDVPVIAKDDRIFGSARFSASVSASGLITIGHPQVQLKKNPEVQYIPSASSYQFVTPHYVKMPALGQTTLFLLARMAGRISFNGSTWGTSFSPFNSLLTFSSYNGATGELTITHPSLTDNSVPVLTNYTSSSVAESYDVTVIGNSNTNFIVRFRKKADDSIPATIPSGVGFTFDRGQSAILPKSAISGAIGVFLDVVQADLRDVNWPNANIWAFGMMGKNKS